MKISQLLSHERVLVGISVSSKKRLLEQLSDLLVNGSDELDSEHVFDSLLARERLGATALGHGVALPHGRLCGLTSTLAAFIHSGNGVEFWGACRDNLVEHCRVWEVYDAALTNQGRGPASIQENITYRNNLIWNCEYSFEYWNNPESARTHDIHFVNNTCINAGGGWAHAQRPNPNGSHLMFYSNTAETRGVVVKYNVFYRSTEWGSRYSRGWNPLPDMDYNVWYAPEGELCFFFREHIKREDVHGYREKTGLDRHSFFGDPELVDPARGDFRLAPDSPARRLRPDGGQIGAAF